LTGLAQVSGRNNITWEEKFKYDLAYIDKGVTLWGDIKIIFMTVGKVFRRADTVREGTASDLDFGDYLLQKGEAEYHTRREDVGGDVRKWRLKAAGKKHVMNCEREYREHVKLMQERSVLHLVS
jgi:hypothetical protein